VTTTRAPVVARAMLVWSVVAAIPLSATLVLAIAEHSAETPTTWTHGVGFFTRWDATTVGQLALLLTLLLPFVRNGAIVFESSRNRRRADVVLAVAGLVLLVALMSVIVGTTAFA
jgi:hypothetical protein